MDIISWEAPEFEYYDRDVLWYLFMAIAATAFILLALWQRNVLFVVFIVIACVTLFAWSQRAPRVHRVSLDETLLTIGNFAPHTLDSFMGFMIAHARQDNPEWGKVLLQSKQRLSTHLTILVPRGKLVQVSERLLRQIPQLEYEESATDAIIRLFKL
jgi:hypothetical protein